MKHHLSKLLAISLIIYSAGPTVAAQYDDDIAKSTAEIQQKTTASYSDPSQRSWVGSAYSTRAMYYSFQDKFSEAISDIKSAMQWRTDESDYENLIDYYRKAGKLADALSTANAAMSKFSGEKQRKFYSKRASIYSAQGKDEEALSDLNYVINSGDNDAYLDRANLLKKMGRADQAIADYKKVIADKENFSRIMAITDLLFYLENLKRDKEALDLLNELVRTDASHLEKRASFYVQRGRLEDALDDLKEVVANARRELAESSAEKKSANVGNLRTALDSRANIYEKLEKKTEAIVDLNEVVSLSPDFYSYLKLFKLLSSLGKKDEAMKCLNQAVRINPESGLKERSDYYKEQKKYELALDDLNQLVKIASVNLESADAENKSQKIDSLLTALSYRVFLSSLQKNYAACMSDLSQTMLLTEKKLAFSKPETKPNIYAEMSGNYKWRASIYEELKKPQEQLADLEEALRIGKKTFEQATEDDKKNNFLVQSNYFDVLEALAKFYLKEGKGEQAIDYMNRLVALDESQKSRRVFIFEKLNKFDLAEADYISLLEQSKKTYKNAPEKKHDDFIDDKKNAFWSVISNYQILSQFYEQRGNKEKALDTLNDALAFSPSSMTVMKSKADLLLKMNQKEKADALFEEIISINPDGLGDEEIQASAFIHFKKYEQALPLLDKVLKQEFYFSNQAKLNRVRVYVGLGKKEKAIPELKLLAKSYEGFELTDEQKKEFNEIQGYLRGYGDKTASEPHSAPASKPAHQVPSVSSINQPIKDKWALVIGISKFETPGHDLKCAAKDAQDFYNYLVNEAGFKKDHICLLLNDKATRKNIMTAFGSKFLPSVSQPGDLVFIFISTHGTPSDKDNGERNYIVAYDTDPANLYPTGVDMDDIYARIKDSVNTDRVLIVMDTCYSGAGVPGKSLSESANFDANQIAQGCGRLVITSSANNEKSYESGNSGNGIFTKYFLQSLRQSKGMVDVKRAFESAQEKVQWEVKSTFNKSQVPQLGGEWEGKELILAAPATNPRTVFGVPFAQSAPTPAIVKPLKQRGPYVVPAKSTSKAGAKR